MTDRWVDEERPVGNVKWQTYKLYIRAATYITWALTITILREFTCNSVKREMLIVV